MVYIDNILIYFETLDQHVHHVRAVLSKLCQYHLFAKLEKCAFHVTTVEFLGYILSPQGIQMDRRKVEAILQWPSPSSIKTVQSFLGFANFYRRFIADFSEIVHPITSLLRKNLVFQWTAEAKKAFQELKT
ncbi:uncharacterized protein [Ambystoma mexicanum]|uniref:uncharacterized protein n=1 Tax=Ambystoma mexicanum TaxID=8296 RepID=UPI0037E9A6AB